MLLKTYQPRRLEEPLRAHRALATARSVHAQLVLRDVAGRPEGEHRCGRDANDERGQVRREDGGGRRRGMMWYSRRDGWQEGYWGCGRG